MKEENQEVQQDNSAVEESRRAVEKNHSKNAPKTEVGNEEQSPEWKKVGETHIGKGMQSVTKHLHKAAAEARHDTRDIADVNLNLDLKSKKSGEPSEETIQNEPSVGGVELNKENTKEKTPTEQTDKPDVSGLSEGKKELASVDASKNVKGEIVDFGKENYKFDKNEQESFYIKTKDPISNKETVTWGKDLERNIQENNYKKGDVVEIEHKGVNPVTVQVPIKDENGKITGSEPLNTHRNTFEVKATTVESIKKEYDESLKSQNKNENIEASPDTKKDQKQEDSQSVEKSESESVSDTHQKEAGKSTEEKKKKSEDEEEQNELDKSFGSEKEGHDGEIYSLENVNEDSVLGTGKQTNNLKDLRPTHHIGYMNRETLPNGQTIAALNIDKDQWLQNATPDKNGNLIVSLYSERFKGNDNFSHSTLTIPKKYVQGLAPDANGRIKLMVVEKNPLAKKSELQVMVDNSENRKSVAMKNGNILNDTPKLEKDRILDRKLKDNGLEHGYTAEVNLTGREVVNKMTPDKQKLIDAMKPKELENMLNHPENRNVYTGYEARFKEKMLENFKEGMPLKVDNKLTGGDGTGDSTIKHVNSDKEQFLVKTDDGKQHQISKNDMLSASATVEDGKKIMGEVVKDIADNVKVGPEVQKEAVETIPEIVPEQGNRPKYIISDDHTKIESKIADIVIGTGLILEHGSIKKGIEELRANKDKALKRDAGYSDDDVWDKNVKAPKAITRKEAEKLKAIVDDKVIDPKESQKEQNGKSMEEVLDKQITPDTKMKDIVNKMDTSDQGAIKKMQPEALENQIEGQKSDLQKSAEKLDKEPEVDIKGQSKEQKTPSELLKEAIVKNDKESVDNILSKEKNVVDKTHIELMNDMKKEGMKLDEGISKSVTQSLPAPKQSKGVSI